MKPTNRVPAGILAAIALAMALYGAKSHAMLFCFNTNTNVGMTYQSGTFVYQVQNNDSPRPDIPNPGLQLLPNAVYAPLAYCYADGPELEEVYAALPDIRYPAVTKNRNGTVTGFRSSIQPGATAGIVVWTGEDAWHIINEF
jgi:hypothetical protein